MIKFRIEKLGDYTEYNYSSVSRDTTITCTINISNAGNYCITVSFKDDFIYKDFTPICKIYIEKESNV